MSKILTCLLLVAALPASECYASNQVDLVFLTKEASGGMSSYDVEYRLTPWGFALSRGPKDAGNREYKVEDLDSLGFKNIGISNENSVYMALKESDGYVTASVFSSITRSSFFLESASFDLTQMDKRNEFQFNVIDFFGVRLVKPDWSLLLKEFKGVEAFVMPFSGYNFSGETIYIPDSLESLTVYNSILDESFFCSVANARGLKELILYGCSLSEDAFNRVAASKIRELENLKEMTVFSCSFDLEKMMIEHFAYPCLDHLKFSSYSWSAQLNGSLTQREQVVASRFPVLEQISIYLTENSSPHLEGKTRAYFLKEVSIIPAASGETRGGQETRGGHSVNRK